MDAWPDIPSFWNLTPWGAFLGLSIFNLISLIRGWLVPKVTHERELAAEAKRGDEWKETALDQRQVNAEIRSQNSALIEQAKVVEQFLRASSPMPDKRKAEGG